MMPAAMENLFRNCSLAAPSPLRAENPQTQAGGDLGGYMKLGRSRLHTHSEEHTHSCRSKRQLGECQRERGTLSAPGSGRGRLWPAMTVREFWLLERWCVWKTGHNSVVKWVCPEQLFKWRAKACWAGTPCTAALPANAQD